MTGFDAHRAQIFVANEYRDSQAQETGDAVNPATEGTEGTFAVCGEEDLEIVLDRAKAAQEVWAARPESERSALLHAVAESIETADHAGMAEFITREHGKPYPESIGELANVASVFRYFAEMVRDKAGAVAGTTSPESFQFYRAFPYGVSVHITPSNYPILIMCWTVAASIAAGNTAIVKPSERTSLTTLRFMRHFRELPPSVVSCVTGGAQTAQSLIRADETDVVAFTGGVEAAVEVNRACAERLIPTVIEAGGNDALIVTDRAPMDVAIAGATTAAFHLSGQVCTGAERVFVHDAVHDEFVEAIAEMAEHLRIGDGLAESEIGPLVSQSARENVANVVDEAVDEGATVVCGGRIPPDHEIGWFYEPTVLADVTPEMRVMSEEVFGPVAPICTVSSLADAIELANRSCLGLGASVFTTDLTEAMLACERLEAGMVWINNPMIDNEALPFGGWKRSGVGRELGRHGLDAFRQTKMGVLDWDPSVQEWWYPYPSEWFYGKDGRRL